MKKLNHRKWRKCVGGKMFIYKKIIQVWPTTTFYLLFFVEFYGPLFVPNEISCARRAPAQNINLNFDRQLHHQVVPSVKINDAKIFFFRNLTLFVYL
jgi:hypothetical protein